MGGIVDTHGDEDGREVARLLVSEVVTNSVLHGGGERLTLHVRVEDDVVRVEVTDAGPGIPPGRDVAMPPPDSVTGRGLGILARSARRWGHRSAPARVWFELPCRGCEEPDRP